MLGAVRNGQYAPFSGQLDEIRASNAIRSPDWIALEYATMNQGSGFYTVGNETGAGPITITSVSPTALTTTGATITWTTNVAADSQVNYGTTTAYGSPTTLNYFELDAG
jgi:hypothetical protein